MCHEELRSKGVCHTGILPMGRADLDSSIHPSQLITATFLTVCMMKGHL